MDQVRADEFHRLLAKKSSFQAWKCVSFVYALLALVLLTSKLHEVTNDTRLLLSIDQLLSRQAMNTSNSSAAALGSAASSSSWPPMPLELMLIASRPVVSGNESSPATAPAATTTTTTTTENLQNEPVDGNSSSTVPAPVESQQPPPSTSLLMSHMHNSIGRELSGNQLLRQEVDSFLGEFRSAKSTLALSSLLVLVYIISWILMTLAINDTRISNDVSLRNILLLSVFGAIDMAASVAFVMVRLIMFNVKNNHFLAEMVGWSGLRDTPTRLSPDQLSAFMALRLVAMRSCSASVDLQVSVIVALLTVLRLYAIVRALSYYRKLRRYNNSFAATPFQDLHLLAEPPHSAELAGQSKSALSPTLWLSNNHQPAPNHQHLISSNQPHATSRTSHSLQPHLSPLNEHFRLSAVPGGGGGGPHSASGAFHISSQPAGPNSTSMAAAADQQQEQLNRLTGSLRASYDQLNELQHQIQQQVNGSSGASSSKQLHQQQQQQVAAAANAADGGGRGGVGGQAFAAVASHKQQQQQQRTQHLLTTTGLGTQMTQTNRPPPQPLLILNQPQHQQQPTKPMTLSQSTHRRHKQQMPTTNELRPPVSAPNVLLVNGRPHRLVAAASHLNELHQPQVAVPMSAVNTTAKRRKHHKHSIQRSLAGGFESEPVEATSSRHLKQRQHQLFVATGEQDLRTATDVNNNNNNNSGSNGNHFTLLSASQLDKLSRKLLARGSSATLATATSRTAPSAAAAAAQLSKYKLIARYHPISDGDQQQDSQQVEIGGPASGGRRRQRQRQPANDATNQTPPPPPTSLDELLSAAAAAAAPPSRRIPQDETTTSQSSSSSSSSSSSAMSSSDLSTGDDADSDAVPERSVHRRDAAAHNISELAGLRQMEELVGVTATADGKQTYLLEEQPQQQQQAIIGRLQHRHPTGRELLLEKSKDYDNVDNNNNNNYNDDYHDGGDDESKLSSLLSAQFSSSSSSSSLSGQDYGDKQAATFRFHSPLDSMPSNGVWRADDGESTSGLADDKKQKHQQQPI